ncbi:flavin reductase family protein [Olsenella massiliensis]|uniref:flavin reductase family protein n=1 Tax=Olsenella massiliensis TaxID=1622075 RepID=UPI00071D9FE8|nr:flavin reductase family protein [Olsenella massiliensis]
MATDELFDERALFKFTSGLYVVSAADGDEVGACIINTGLQVTSKPFQVQVVVNKENHTEQVIEKAGHFALCPLTQDVDMLYIGRFGFRSSADIDKFDGVKTETTSLGDPYECEHAASVIACEVRQTLDVGTHMIFVGEVKEARPLSDVEPLTYGYYHTVLKGKTPPKASSYIG